MLTVSTALVNKNQPEVSKILAISFINMTAIEYNYNSRQQP